MFFTKTPAEFWAELFSTSFTVGSDVHRHSWAWMVLILNLYWSSNISDFKIWVGFEVIIKIIKHIHTSSKAYTEPCYYLAKCPLDFCTSRITFFASINKLLVYFLTDSGGAGLLCIQGFFRGQIINQFCFSNPLNLILLSQFLYKTHIFQCHMHTRQSTRATNKIPQVPPQKLHWLRPFPGCLIKLGWFPLGTDQLLTTVHTVPVGLRSGLLSLKFHPIRNQLWWV